MRREREAGTRTGTRGRPSDEESHIGRGRRGKHDLCKGLMREGEERREGSGLSARTGKQGDRTQIRVFVLVR